MFTIIPKITYKCQTHPYSVSRRILKTFISYACFECQFEQFIVYNLRSMWDTRAARGPHGRACGVRKRRAFQQQFANNRRLLR